MSVRRASLFFSLNTLAVASTYSPSPTTSVRHHRRPRGKSFYLTISSTPIVSTTFRELPPSRLGLATCALLSKPTLLTTTSFHQNYLRSTHIRSLAFVPSATSNLPGLAAKPVSPSVFTCMVFHPSKADDPALTSRPCRSSLLHTVASAAETPPTSSPTTSHPSDGVLQTSGMRLPLDARSQTRDASSSSSTSSSSSSSSTSLSRSKLNGDPLHRSQQSSQHSSMDISSTTQTNPSQAKVSTDRNHCDDNDAHTDNDAMQDDNSLSTTRETPPFDFSNQPDAMDSEHDSSSDGNHAASSSTGMEDVPSVERALSTSTVTSAESTESAASEGRESTEEEPKLSFCAGVAFVPHPMKRNKGGEDAYFVQEGALGVFDGVGGWSSIGVDAGLYSKELARLTSSHMARNGSASAVDALRLATKNNHALGSSTACVVGLVGNRLLGINLGDSGLVVIRGWEVVYRTRDQQHYFNCPYQVGTDSVDTVDVGAPIEFELQCGDCVVIGTDGLWDNVFSKEVVDIVLEHAIPSTMSVSEPDTPHSDNNVSSANSTSETATTDATSTTSPASTSFPTTASPTVDSKQDDDDCVMGSDCQEDDTSMVSECPAADDCEKSARTIVKSLADAAIRVANDDRARSPFAVNAQNAGHSFLGGKVDDITIIAAFVVEGNNRTASMSTIVNGQREGDAENQGSATSELPQIYNGPS